MDSLRQLLDDYKLTWKTELRFPPRPQDIFDLTRGNIREFLASVQMAFDGRLISIYERTPIIDWNKEEPGPFRYANTLVEPDLSQIIFISEVNRREERVDIFPMGTVKFAFLRPTRQSYSKTPSGVYITTRYSGPNSLNLWYDRREIVLARDNSPPVS
ncbi:MAG TPA: hypothetical protein VJJ52_00955 [Candidatus Nanoarchaeia archaeon]|nr:hypothetical protein [Candidatus Nanoarchaeia archaeon]